MPKFLIIPDVHNKTQKVKALLARIGNEFDQIVQLGDWFDDFGDNPEAVASAATDLNFIVKNYPMLLLWGNHDLPYRYPSKYTWCPGWSEPKMRAIIHTLDKPVWDMFNFYLELDGWTLSHAGFHPLMKTLINNMGGIYTILDRGLYDPILWNGPGRGGIEPVGGPIWLDWDSEFVLVPELKQIVGHSPHRKPQYKGVNLCLDTHLNHYATLIDGKLEVCEWTNQNLSAVK